MTLLLVSSSYVSFRRQAKRTVRDNSYRADPCTTLEPGGTTKVSWFTSHWIYCKLSDIVFSDIQFSPEFPFPPSGPLDTQLSTQTWHLKPRPKLSRTYDSIPDTTVPSSPLISLVVWLSSRRGRVSNSHPRPSYSPSTHTTTLHPYLSSSMDSPSQFHGPILKVNWSSSGRTH